jgi:hypothetical protein
MRHSPADEGLMVATVCLRLAAGLLGATLILEPEPIPPRFFRVQHLAALALVAVAAFFLYGVVVYPGWVPLAAAILFCFAGSIVWHLHGAPAGRVINFLAGAALLVCLVTLDLYAENPGLETMGLFDDLASAAVLGTATTAMLMGHSYLISPAMTIAPLLRLLAALGIALVARFALSCFALSQWTAAQAQGNLDNETLLWLGARWLLGFIGPAVLGWMAWEAARIRSTQSATGILYVVVVLVFLGELTGLLLMEKTRWPL